VGTAGNDAITVLPAKRGVEVRFGTEVVGTFSPTGQIIVQAAGGDDLVVVLVGSKAILDGGPGSDGLISGSGSQVLVGGDGADVLISGGGRDVLVGGGGGDALTGGEDDDALVAGTGATSLAALSAARDGWAGSASYAVRSAAIAAALAPLGDDSVPDVVVGGNGRDWFAVRTAGVLRDLRDAAGTEILVAL
jgi:Ca2+-binding RTX toxin-like protein